VEKRRIQSIGQKYGLGRQPLRAGGPPRRSDEEMRQDLTEILSMEKQRQLLGGEGDNGVTQVVAQMMRVDRGQIEMDIKMAQAEIQRRKGTITRQEIEQISQRLLQKVLGNERAQQMLGMSTEGTGAIIEQAASLQTP
jgi:ribosomal 50S subunit-associated protein YjgA (DUF615 family)